MPTWIKLAASDLTYSLGDSEFGGMTVTEDGDASFSGFSPSMSDYLWRVTGISGFVAPLSLRVVCIHTAGTFSGTADIQYGNPVNTNAIPQWESGAADFTTEFDLETGETFRLNVDGDFTGFSAVFEVYAYLDGEAPPEGGCFWRHDSMVGVTEDCGGDTPPGEFDFESTVPPPFGSGGSLLVEGDWTGGEPNLILDTIDAHIMIVGGHAAIHLTAAYDATTGDLITNLAADPLLGFYNDVNGIWLSQYGDGEAAWVASGLSVGTAYRFDATFFDPEGGSLGTAHGVLTFFEGF